MLALTFAIFLLQKYVRHNKINVFSQINCYKGHNRTLDYYWPTILQTEPNKFVVDFSEGGSFAPNEPPLRTGL